MARQTKSPIVGIPAQLDVDKMKQGIVKLNRRIKELENFDAASITGPDDPGVEALSAAIDGSLASIFGPSTADYRRYSGATSFYSSASNLQESRENFIEDREKARLLLIQARNFLFEELEDAGHNVPDAGATTVTSAAPAGYGVIIQRGRLDISDPPEGSPYRYNSVNDDHPEIVGELTTTLTDLVEKVKGDNSLLGDVLKKQLVVLLETTVQELKAPYADTGRIKAAAATLRSVVQTAAKKGIENALTSKVSKGADALIEFVKELF